MGEKRRRRSRRRRRRRRRCRRRRRRRRRRGTYSVSISRPARTMIVILSSSQPLLDLLTLEMLSDEKPQNLFLLEKHDHDDIEKRSGNKYFSQKKKKKKKKKKSSALIPLF